MPREEWDTSTWTECDYIDPGISWIEDDDRPKEWRCPECGGTELEGIHRDYRQSGLKGSSFSVSVEDDDE